MTLLAIVDGSNIITYPASPAQCSTYANRAIGPKALAKRDLSAYGIVRVTEVAKPTITESQTVAETLPLQVAGVWTQQWEVSNLSAGEITNKLAQERATIRRLADDAMGDYSAIQMSAIAEVCAAQNDGSPSQAKYPIVYGYAAGAGITVGAAVSLVQGWRTALATIAQAQAAAMKQLSDNGVAGIPAARAIMAAL